MGSQRRNANFSKENIKSSIVINEQEEFMTKCKKRYENKLTIASTPYETNNPDDDE